MKKFSLSIIFFFFTIVIIAQDDKSEAVKLIEKTISAKDITVDSAKYWKYGGVISLNGQQVSLTNWSAGGNSSISLAGLVNVFAKYKKGKINWETNLDLGYGVINQGDAKKWWKNDDKIQFSTLFGRELKKHWYLAMLADFRTQFTNGYNYPNDSVYISKFMAPAYGLAAIGFDYKPNDNFSLLISPITGKFTYVIDDSLAKYGAFGVQKEIRDPNDGRITQRYLTHREEFGAYLRMKYQTKVMENITFQTMLELFSNYLHNPENIDVNWSTLTTFKVNNFVSATLSTQLIYDDDIKVLRTSGDQKGTVGPDVQLKQVLGVGFTYKF